MKKLLISIFITLSLFISSASAEFFSDIIVTSPNGIWTDSRAYVSLPAAIDAVGVLQRTIVIPSQQSVGNITIPSNVTLKFERDGAIIHSGKLTINTKNIIAENRQIFAGAGDIDFISGSTVKSGWFANLDKALDVTNDDTLTMVISKSETTDADMEVGDDVTLRWESPFIITVAVADTVSNIKNIEAGNYQIFAGAGDFDFLDGTELRLSWFSRLRSVVTWVENEEVTLTVTEPSTVSFSDTIPSNLSIVVPKGGMLNLDPGVTITDNGPFISGLYQVFSGTGTIVFGLSSLGEVYPQWWGASGITFEDNTAHFTSAQTALTSFSAAGGAGGTIRVIGQFWLEDFTMSPGVALMGDSRTDPVTRDLRSTILAFADTTTAIIIMKANCSIINIAINGREVDGITATGIKMGPSTDGFAQVVSRSYITGIGTGEHAIYIDEGDNSTLSNILFHGSNSNVFIEDSKAWMIKGCSFILAGEDYSLSISSALNNSHGIIEGSVFESYQVNMNPNFDFIKIAANGILTTSNNFLTDAANNNHRASIHILSGTKSSSFYNNFQQQGTAGKHIIIDAGVLGFASFYNSNANSSNNAINANFTDNGSYSLFFDIDVAQACASIISKGTLNIVAPTVRFPNNATFLHSNITGTVPGGNSLLTSLYNLTLAAPVGYEVITTSPFTLRSYTTAALPVPATVSVGTLVYDTTRGKVLCQVAGAWKQTDGGAP